jgi:hypothetical protein
MKGFKKHLIDLQMKGNHMDTGILNQLQEACAEELVLVRGDLGQLEQAVETMLKSFGVGLLQRLVDQGRNGYEGPHLSCTCGCLMRFVGHRARAIHTIFGWITVHRAYYHCPRCGRSKVPYDQASGLGPEQLSPALAKACCLLAVDDSFAEVARKVKSLLAEEVCDTTVERLVHQVGSVLVKQQDEELERFRIDREVPISQVQPKRLYVSVDGTNVHEQDGWHEAKTGCIYWYDERFGQQKWYAGRFCSSQEFGWQMWLAGCRCGLREALDVVYLGDGAGWVRSEHGRHFHRAVFIIDWYHASEHVWDCGKQLYGEGTEATDRWVHQRLSLLWDGQTRQLLDELRQEYRNHRGGKREALENLCRYISVNEEQMRYDVFRANGYDIGSGAVEGACKHVVGKRLKQSGMIWIRAGSSATLALRICWLNGQWESFWRQKPLAA